MGLFGKWFGGGVDKNALIKDLVRLRIRNDPLAAAMGFDERTVDSFSELQLLGLPEATITTIVESWVILHKRGASDAEIFQRIEEHRSQAFLRGAMPTVPTLASYVKYRLELEHSDGAPIDDLFIDSAVEVAKKAYGA